MSAPTQKFAIKDHKLWGQCSVGEGVYISDMARVRGKLRAIDIRDGASIADFCMLLAEDVVHIGENVRIGYQCAILAHASVRICAHAKLGVGVKVLAGYTTEDGWQSFPVEIGTGAVISPGAVILPGAKIHPAEFIAPNEVVDARGRHPTRSRAF
jgi:carbonic anhydrase/acetyltransferase-like protein (isoleucine patch superfamily)